MKKTYIFIILTLMLLPLLNAEQVWNGNAAVIRSGEFESSGLFAASNSFAKGTKIDLTNVDNGETVTVTIMQRIEDDTNVFILLSNEAAEALGMSTDDVIRVSAVLSSGYTPDITTLPEDLPYNPDPEINPAAETETKDDIIEYIPEDTTETTDITETADATDAINVIETTDVSDVPDTTEQTEGFKLYDRDPQKNLHVTPHEDQAFALIDVNSPTETQTTDQEYEVADAAIEIEEEEKPQTDSINRPEAESQEIDQTVAEATPPESEKPVVEERVATETDTEELVLADLETPEVGEEEKPTTEEALSTEEPEIAEVDLVPTEPQFPPEDEQVEVTEVDQIETTDTVETTDTTDTTDTVDTTETTDTTDTTETVETTETQIDGSELPLVKTLQEDTYYLQLGAFSTVEIAKEVVSSYGEYYPMAVLSADSTKGIIYKVLVGPLNQDESGTLLYWFQAKGHKDAFLRYID